MIVRPERAGDEAAIRAVTEAAFRTQPMSDGREPAIIDGLRSDGDLALSLVADIDGAVVGHIAFSPVSIADGSVEWYGLGPVSVRPDRHRQGIGGHLIREGIARMREVDAQGIVLLGDPTFYGRFGFEHDPALAFPGPPPEYFQRLIIGRDAPRGVVTYAPAFY